VTAPQREVVLDASVVLRRLLDGSPSADEVIRHDQLVAPGVIVAETVNGLATAVRFASLEVESAAGLLEQFLALPIEVVPDAVLAGHTLGVATELGLSAYDASYVALALVRDVPLVTADKPVAASYPRSELIP
jgi:predicted nucleic acid-binding protein